MGGAAASSISAGDEKNQPELYHCSSAQQREPEVQKTQGVEGSRIVNMLKIASMMNGIYHMHHQQSKDCARHFLFPAELKKLWGLGSRGEFIVFCVISKNIISYSKKLKICHKKGEKPSKVKCCWAHS